MAKLILASGSSRRKELLDQIGVQYTSAAMDIDETPLPDERPRDYVERMAKEKGLAGLSQFPSCTILASDTTVIIENQILGKPNSVDDAITMLQQLSGQVHSVLTAIAMCSEIDGKRELQSQVVETKVEFYPLDIDQIKDYVATGEPMDKAGSYGIQGKGALFVKGIHGSYSSVVGLPLAETGKMLQHFNVPVWQG